MLRKLPVKLIASLTAMLIVLVLGFNNCGPTPYLKEKADKRQQELDSMDSSQDY